MFVVQVASVVRAVLLRVVMDVRVVCYSFSWCVTLLVVNVCVLRTLVSCFRVVWCSMITRNS